MLLALGGGGGGGLRFSFAQASDAACVASFFVEANYAERHACKLAKYLGSEEAVQTATTDTAQMPMRLSEQSAVGADTAYGGLTALQRGLLERQVLDEVNERFFSASARLPAGLLLAAGTTGELVGCAGVEAAVVDRTRSMVLRRIRTPLKKDLKPDGSLPDGMEVRATLACHAVGAGWRRQGLGTELFRRAAAKAAEWDFGPSLLLMVDESDAEARAFYEDHLGCNQLFRDEGATVTRPDWPSTQYSRTVLEVKRVPQPMVALQWVEGGSGAAVPVAGTADAFSTPLPPPGFEWGQTV